MRRRATGIFAAILAWAAVAGPALPATSGPVPLAKVDLRRMMGDWYLVATIPNFFERGMVAGRDVYALTPRGDIREDFSMRRGGFDRKVTRASTRITVRRDSGDADWRVHFGPIALPFQVLWVDPAYRLALFGEQNRKLGWVYSRDQKISDEDYRTALEHFEALGDESRRFRKFIQTPDQIGQTGFWSEGVRAPTMPAR